MVIEDQRRVLLLWRHRFITDTWAWEIPLTQIRTLINKRQIVSGTTILALLYTLTQP